MKKNFSIEHLLAALAVIAGGALRFLNLGKIPLSDLEASLALQALQPAAALTPISGSPLYVIWTNILFFIFEPTNALARCIPAMFGTLLIFSPVLFKKIIGRQAALVLMCILAFSPAFIASSRQVDGLAVILASLAFLFGFLVNRQWAAAGVCLAIGLLGGSSFWLAVLILGAAWLSHRFFPIPTSDDEDGFSIRDTFAGLRTTGLRTGLAWLAGALVLAGTFFFTRPYGIGAGFNDLAGFIQHWSTASLTGLSPFIAALGFCETIMAFLGLWGMISGWWRKTGLEMAAGRWFVVALLVLLIFPGKRVIDLAFLLIPLYVVAARVLADWFSHTVHEKLVSFSLGLAILALLVFAWINTAGIPGLYQMGGETQIRALSSIGAILLSLMITVLVAWGWSLESAGVGLRIGFGGILLAGWLFASFSATGLGRQPANEIWRTDAYPQDADLMVSTITQFSEWNASSSTGLDITVMDYDTPSMRWALRSFDKVDFTDSLLKNTSPSVIITPDKMEPGSPSKYTGQDLVWSQEPSWSIMLPMEWLKWVIHRDAPTGKLVTLLWVRSDLFAGAKNLAEPASE